MQHCSSCLRFFTQLFWWSNKIIFSDLYFAKFLDFSKIVFPFLFNILLSDLCIMAKEGVMNETLTKFWLRIWSQKKWGKVKRTKLKYTRSVLYLRYISDFWNIKFKACWASVFDREFLLITSGLRAVSIIIVIVSRCVITTLLSVSFNIII